MLRQPWGAPPGSERDELEDVAIHRIAYDLDSGSIIGCGRIHQLDAHTAQIRFMAVAPEWQHCGVGSALLASLEQWARDTGITTIILHARSTAATFYLKHAYRIVAPAHTLYGAIEHVLMEKHLV